MVRQKCSGIRRSYLDMATDEERTQLTTLKKYRVLLSRVDTSKAPDIDWPTAI